jgi:hypothetical protein
LDHEQIVRWSDDEVEETDLRFGDVCCVSVKQLTYLEPMLAFKVTLSEKLDEKKFSPVFLDRPLFHRV